VLADPSAIEGDWLVALDQTAGRGRQRREWQSATGNFYGTTLVALRPDDPPAPSLAIISGLALIETVDVAVPAQPLMLKWPNDLMLMSRKLGGILLERSGDLVAAGFGVNLATAPQLVDRQAAALSGEVSPEAFAPLLAASFARLLELWRRSEPALLVQAWLARAHPAGTRLTVHSGAGELVAGRFEGIEADGAMRLRRDDGAVETIRAGDVSLG
jgi:BirA family biotin operon repressor/biotin-[acetyl-CoA-carboxylase] ligase